MEKVSKDLKETGPVYCTDPLCENEEDTYENAWCYLT